MEQPTTVIEKFMIPHQAFANAHGQIQQAFKYALHNSAAEGLALIGESGTGKTSVLESVLSENEPRREAGGMRIPILYASVPSGPTKKSLASVLLAAMHDPDPDCGTVFELERRLKRHMEDAGTCMIMIDEFQHFYDRGKHKVMHEVADWLKRLIDATKSTLIVAGLPTCMGVIDQNEQLARRFLRKLELPRFSWADIGEREQFKGILRCYEAEIIREYEIPSFSSESMAFRFHCATGGLMGYLSKLLKEVLRNADSRSTKSICLEDFALAHNRSMWRSEQLSRLPQPFSRSFELEETEELMRNVAKIGTIPDEPTTSSRARQRKPRRQSVNERLRMA